jgi:membrane protein YqaA with SNARE-associated domain
MIDYLGPIALALGAGFASAIIPVINAEAATLVAAAAAHTPVAIACILAIAVGQTAGKIVVYEAARGGRRLSDRWRRHRPARSSEDPSAAAPPGPPTRWQRTKAWVRRLGERLLAAMDGRWRGDGVLLLAAAVGIPPLYAAAALAGVLRLRRVDFIICVLVGRVARFLIIAWPVLAARQSG